MKYSNRHHAWNKTFITSFGLSLFIPYIFQDRYFQSIYRPCSEEFKFSMYSIWASPASPSLPLLKISSGTAGTLFDTHRTAHNHECQKLQSTEYIIGIRRIAVASRWGRAVQNLLLDITQLRLACFRSVLSEIKFRYGMPHEPVCGKRLTSYGMVDPLCTAKSDLGWHSTRDVCTCISLYMIFFR